MKLFNAMVGATAGLILSLSAHADDTTVKHKHLGTKAQQAAAAEWNRTHFPTTLTPYVSGTSTWNVLRPFSEIETTGFVAISGDSDFELPQLRLAIAQNLPPNVTLIVYVDKASQVTALQKTLGAYLDSDHLKFLTISVPSDGDPIWARDSLPYPVYLQPAAGSAASSFGLVDSIYPQDFNPDPTLQQALSLPMVQTNQQFRGGNLLLDLNANCFAENANEVAALANPQQFFTQFFGCKSVTLLTHEGGIGDIDERIKFLTGTDVLTDNADYQSELQSKGYTVHMIPSTGNDGETYMNTLYVNGTIFVPQMNIAADTQAIAAYQALGMKAVGVVTKELADDGDGNIHCVTMNYPPGTFVSAPEQGSQFVKFAPGTTVPRE